MSAKFPRGGGGAGPFLARSLQGVGLTAYFFFFCRQSISQRAVRTSLEEQLGPIPESLRKPTATGWVSRPLPPLWIRPCVR